MKNFKKKQKAMAIVFSLILITSLAACGSGNSSSASAPSKAEESAEKSVEESAVEVSTSSDADVAETTESAVVEPEEKDVVYLEGEETLFENDDIKVVKTSYEQPDNDNLFRVSMRLENKSEKDLSYAFRNWATNRVNVYGKYETEIKEEESKSPYVKAGESADGTVELSNMLFLGIDSIDELRCVFQYKAVDEEEVSSKIPLSFYPTGKSEGEIVPAEPFSEDEAEVVMENDIYSIALINKKGEEKEYYNLLIENRSDAAAQAHFYLVNKSDKTLTISLNVDSINGYNHGTMGTVYQLAPGCGDFYTLFVPQSIVDKYKEDIGGDTISELTYSVYTSYEKDGENETDFSDPLTYKVEGTETDSQDE